MTLIALANQYTPIIQTIAMRQVQNGVGSSEIVQRISEKIARQILPTSSSTCFWVGVLSVTGYVWHSWQKSSKRLIEERFTRLVEKSQVLLDGLKGHEEENKNLSEDLQKCIENLRQYKEGLATFLEARETLTSEMKEEVNRLKDVQESFCQFFDAHAKKSEALEVALSRMALLVNTLQTEDLGAESACKRTAEEREIFYKKLEGLLTGNVDE